MTFENELLDRLAPVLSWDADWADVLDRAGHHHERGSRRIAFPSNQRTRQLLLVGLLVGAIVVVTPAFGVISAIRDLFEGTPPTPLVQQHFLYWNQMQRQAAHPPRWAHLGVDVTEAHGVLAIKTSDGPIYLWAAPTRNGGECWLLQFVNQKNSSNAPLGPSGCRVAEVPPALIPWGVTPSPSSWRSGGTNDRHPSLGILIGQAFGRASYVIVESSERARVKVPVVEHFFLATVATNATIRKISSYDTNGTQLAESRHASF